MKIDLISPEEARKRSRQATEQALRGVKEWACDG